MMVFSQNTLFEQIHKASPDQRLIVHSAVAPSSATRGEINRAAKRLAHTLKHDYGIGEGSVVALQMPSWQEWAVCAMAIVELHATLLPVWTIYDSKELAFILKDANACLFVSPSQWKTINFIERLQLANSEIPHLTLEQLNESVNNNSPIMDVTELSGRDENAIALLIYTSGTTSNPKGVCHSYAGVMAEVMGTQTHMGDICEQLTGQPLAVAGSRLCPWPLGHIAGALEIYRFFCGGPNLVLMDEWDAQRAAQLIAEYQLFATSGTPYHLSTLLDAADKSGTDISSLKDYLVGAAPVPSALIDRCKARGIKTYRSYGSTEHPTVSMGRPDDPLEKRRTTEGRLLPGSTVKVIDEEGFELALGEVGELLTQGPDRCVGYLHASLNREHFTEDGWLKTGDIGFMDDEGYLHVVDRKKDVIIRGGSNISSRDVEDVLCFHPAIAEVAEVAVVAAPHPSLGEVVAAVVVLNENHTLSIEALGQYFSEQGVAKFKTPEKLVTVDTLPRNTTGKVLKNQLRAQYFPVD